MRTILCTILLLILVPLSLPADEGMWLLPLLRLQKLGEMQAMGLQLQEADIYNPNGSSLKDAVVIFGGGCTGEVISPDGLVITNHHCGYGQVQRHSSPEHDYLTDGFWAMKREEELPNPGLSVTFINRIEDVTDYVLQRLEERGDSTGMDFLSIRHLNELAKERIGADYLAQHPGTQVEIRPFYGGNIYYMYVKTVYPDVRLVGAPPSSIGKFGADTDNWMWPRHTGDFSIFRIYADADGKPSPYSESNVPLRSERWLKISLRGLNDNDFAMMIGFPGRTNTYYTSWETAERRDIDNAVRIRVRTLRQEAMLEEMLKSPAIRISYSNKYSGSTNAWKNAIGSNRAITTLDLEQVQQAEHDKLLAWAKQAGKPEYGEALRLIEQLVHDRRSLRLRSWMLDEAIVRGIEFSAVPTDVSSIIDALRNGGKDAQQEQIRLLTAAFRRFFNKDYSPEVDRKISKIMLKEYRSRIPAAQQPAHFAEIDKKHKGNVDRYVDHLFRTSIFGSEAKFEAFVQSPSVKILETDPMILFARAVQDERKALSSALSVFDLTYAEAHRDYLKGLMEMYGPKMNFPDANSTIRLTYGRKRGYHPSNAVYYEPQTTLEGVIEKEDPDNWEFVVPDRLKSLYQSKDFGPYALPDGRLPVAFTADTHTTGGNSGSPVMNARGELVGINFDRNWEGVGGDIQYLPDFQRSIIVDIRYVLFVIDKYAGAGYLLKEMEIVRD
ncbi:MAG: S46 family peptidase [Tannerellaceae bacterium]|jgi:hypothetical protein|nr:S46 family peptidase [Tannerellaceae bacterium]